MGNISTHIMFSYTQTRNLVSNVNMYRLTIEPIYPQECNDLICYVLFFSDKVQHSHIHPVNNRMSQHAQSSTNNLLGYLAGTLFTN